MTVNHSLPTPKINSLPTPTHSQHQELTPNTKHWLTSNTKSTFRRRGRVGFPFPHWYWGVTSGTPSQTNITGKMINTEKPLKGIQPFRLGGNHQGTIHGEWPTLRNPSRGFNPLKSNSLFKLYPPLPSTIPSSKIYLFISTSPLAFHNTII